MSETERADSIHPIPSVDEADMRALVEKMGDGTFLARDIYRVHCEMMAEQDREPVSKRMLGGALRKACQRQTTKSVNRVNMRAWVLRARFLGWIDPTA
jgi:hypothetical protein